MFTQITGTGLGFRRELLESLQHNDLTHIDFFELAPENWIGMGGKYPQLLRAYTERFPFVSHGLSLSLGGTDPLNEELLLNIKAFLDEHNIALYTEHLSWCAHNGQLYDLLPIPFTEDAVTWVAQRIRRAQEILERQIGIENSSYYITPPNSQLSEDEFINAVIAESGCFLHLDVNNLYVNSRNLHYDPINFLNKLSPNNVGYLHVAGHYVENDGWIVDTHGAPVIDPVWDLLRSTYIWLGDRAKDVGTCLERDFNFPPFSALIAEIQQIKTVKNQALNNLSQNPVQSF